MRRDSFFFFPFSLSRTIGFTSLSACLCVRACVRQTGLFSFQTSLAYDIAPNRRSETEICCVKIGDTWTDTVFSYANWTKRVG